jgi:hypothetical protein
LCNEIIDNWDGLISSSTEIESIFRLIRTRFVYILAATVVVIAGLASRRYRGQLPAFLAEYAGDTLWALMLFLLVSTLLAGRPVLARAAISLALAFLVEISQLYHAPWIDSIRQTTLGSAKERTRWGQQQICSSIKEIVSNPIYIGSTSRPKLDSKNGRERKNECQGPYGRGD